MQWFIGYSVLGVNVYLKQVPTVSDFANEDWPRITTKVNEACRFSSFQAAANVVSSMSEIHQIAFKIQPHE